MNSNKVIILGLIAGFITTPAWADVNTRLNHLEDIVNNQLNLDTLNKIERLKQEINLLRGSLEESQHEIRKLIAEQAELVKMVNQKNVDNATKLQQLNQLEKKGKIEEIIEKALKKDPPDTKVLSKEVNSDLEVSDGKAEYDKLFLLVQAKNYALILPELQAYIDKYPKNLYTANAYYWLGEVYHSKWKQTNDSLELRKAESAFQKILDNFSSHPKAPDSLLRLSVLAEENNNLAVARAYLLKLLAKYPTSELAVEAKNKLEQFNKS